MAERLLEQLPDDDDNIEDRSVIRDACNLEKLQSAKVSDIQWMRAMMDTQVTTQSERIAQIQDAGIPLPIVKPLQHDSHDISVSYTVTPETLSPPNALTDGRDILKRKGYAVTEDIREVGKITATRPLTPDEKEIVGKLRPASGEFDSYGVIGLNQDIAEMHDSARLDVLDAYQGKAIQALSKRGGAAR